MHERAAAIFTPPLPADAVGEPISPFLRPKSDRGYGLRVLMIVESSAGGTGRHVLDLAEGLIHRGCDVHVIYSTIRIDHMFKDRLEELSGLPHAGLAIRTSPHPGDLAIIRQIRQYMRDHGPFDAIHGHSSKGGALARLAALGTGMPAYYTLHGLIMMDPGLPRWKWALYLSIELLLARRTARIIAVSPEESRSAVRLGLGNRRVITIPNGVGPAKLTPRTEARAAMSVDPDATVVGFVGRLVEQKAPEVLIRGFAIATKTTPKARLAIVGSGPLEESMCQLAEQLGIGDKIRWLGPRDARTVYAGFDLFALSSRKEGLPYVVLEAMAAGLPVVATSSAGVEILIDPGKSGEVVPPDDAAAFGAALSKYLTDPAQLADAGKASLKRASLFTIDVMTDRTLDAYIAVAHEAHSS